MMHNNSFSSSCVGCIIIVCMWSVAELEQEVTIKLYVVSKINAVASTNENSGQLQEISEVSDSVLLIVLCIR